MYKKIFILFLALFVSISAKAEAFDHNKNIQFSSKTDFIDVENSVIRADRDIYLFNSGKDQILSIDMSSVECNGCIEVKVLESGQSLFYHSEEQTQAKKNDGIHWKGKLPVSGAYKIVVSGTRGNLTYKLKIRLSEKL